VTDVRKAPRDASNLGAVIHAYMRAHGLSTHGEMAAVLGQAAHPGTVAPG